MADIFISYSRKDSAHAEQLTELLTSSGLSCWIDKSGIHGAEQWATEIVEGIRACTTFIILLSPNSIASDNVLRELSLASEKRKRVLPVDLELAVLPSSFEYPLAGLQRVAISDFDSILRAHHHGVERVAHQDARKSLMILPFEDLSPSGDNGWFADGIVSEMISALSNVKALRVSDTQATKDFKRYQGTLPIYAREMNIRYFVQGDVRKFGDNIKITSRLLDIETGDYLWQDTLKGTMDDIFDIQEKVAAKVVDGLNIILTKEEKSKLAERGTENAEAYELYLKANEYFARQTKEGFQLAIQLDSEAIKLDPGYANAYLGKATDLAGLYRFYNRDPALLEEGLNLVTEGLRLKPGLWRASFPLSNILQLQGKHEEAERTANEYIRNAPDDPGSHFALAYFYGTTGEPAKAIPAWEEALRLDPGDLTILFNLVMDCNSAKDEEKQRHWAEVAIPLFEKHLKLFPDDENKRVDHAVLLNWSGRIDDARKAARGLESLRDGGALYNSACLQFDLEDYEAALKTFRKALEAGYKSTMLLKEFLTDDKEGVIALQGTPEYEEVKRIVEEIEAEAKANG